MYNPNNIILSYNTKTDKGINTSDKIILETYDWINSVFPGLNKPANHDGSIQGWGAAPKELITSDSKLTVKEAGIYQVTLKKSCHFAKCDWFHGCHAGYTFTYKGESVSIENEIFHFKALSLKEAQDALDLTQVDSLYFVRELTTYEKQKLQGTRSYNK